MHSYILCITLSRFLLPNHDSVTVLPSHRRTLLTEIRERVLICVVHNTFEAEGIDTFFCAPHEALAMVGRVIVDHSDPHEQPGLAPPQDDLLEDAQMQIAELNEAIDETLGHVHMGERRIVPYSSPLSVSLFCCRWWGQVALTKSSTSLIFANL